MELALNLKNRAELVNSRRKCMAQIVNLRASYWSATRFDKTTRADEWRDLLRRSREKYRRSG